MVQDFFAPLLPWQENAWQQVTNQYHHGHLPHGLLAGGMAGIGKHAFVWRLVAWLLCQQKTQTGACGVCQSCQWLQAGTHPDLHILPHEQEKSIKIDDIRALQDFFYAKNTGVRIVVLDNCDAMTLGASNALLKTLEEPSDGIFLLLVSDYPSRLLPTIKSRVQNLPLNSIDPIQADSYLRDKLGEQADVAMLLQLSDFAPLTALALPSQPWYDKRALWLRTFVALQTGRRQAVQASDYWQSVLSLADFVCLSRLMVLELWRLGLGLDGLHQDIDVSQLLVDMPLNAEKLSSILASLDDVAVAVHQNVNDKSAYDLLMVVLSDAK